jgi:hypothetical protein
MSDYGELCQFMREERKQRRAKYGVPCPECVRLLPKAHPSILLPKQTCKIHGYKDQRRRIEVES